MSDRQRIPVRKNVYKWERASTERGPLALKAREVRVRSVDPAHGVDRSGTEYTDGKNFWFCAFGTTSPKFRYSYEAHSWFMEQMDKGQEELEL